MMDFQHGVSRVHRHVCRFAVPYMQQASSHSSAFTSLSPQSSIKRQDHVDLHLCSQGSEGDNVPSSVKRRHVGTDLCGFQWRTFSTSSSKADIGNRHSGRDSGREEKDDQHSPTDNGMNLRLSVENDYLSWMRNSYIMTLGGVSMLHFDLWSAGTVAGAAALITASMNIFVGSVGYLHNLRSLRRRGHISAFMCGLCQLWTLLHFLFWGTVLMVLFPEYRLIEVTEVDDAESKDDES